ncbi:1-acyl-sn-glycerol-3-phosphate acyltransferase alpha-like [Varanus komodoensis]|uniref:1-acyl-sn-glycerol-3-phosphate acyltransferase alpha-like n=1 Tax=Varanus komodoensis TaxID=61221 RepID=UPI001CF7E651|nr:1-acyl-sn-glycerol-3-phosphate acyltransferase alpha-like [Varanus komodoensis]
MGTVPPETKTLLLYLYSNTFRYYFKVCYFNGWILVWSFVLLPIIALRGRDVANVRILRFMMLPLKYLYGIKINVQGATNLSLQGPYVMVCNHQRNLDFLGMFQILPERSTLMVKKEVLHYLATGVLCWLSGFIFIDYKKREETIRILAATADTMVRDKLRIWVFPEGTQNCEPTMLPFKSEAFHLAVQAQVPIVPVVISSYQQFFNKKIKKFTTGEVTIRILPPMKTAGLSQSDVPELRDCVWETMLSAVHELSGGPRKQTCIPQEENSQAT